MLLIQRTVESKVYTTTEQETKIPNCDIPRFDAQRLQTERRDYGNRWRINDCKNMIYEDADTSHLFNTGSVHVHISNA